MINEFYSFNADNKLIKGLSVLGWYLRSCQNETKLIEYLMNLIYRY